MFFAAHTYVMPLVASNLFAAFTASRDARDVHVWSSHTRRDATYFRGYPRVSLEQAPWNRTTLASLLDASGDPGGVAAGRPDI